MGSTKWLLAALAGLLYVLVGTAPAHADPFRVIVRVTSDASRALSDRIRGQTSDLSIELVTVDTGGPLETGLPSQVGSATSIAQVYSADTVVWFDDLGFGAREDRLLVLQTHARRLLVRGVGDSGGRASKRGSASAELEAAALIVRGAVQAIMEGGVIGVEQSRVVEAEAEKPPPAPPPPPPTPFEVGWNASALPGAVRVPLRAASQREGFAFTATAGYGYTESILGEGDVNQRVGASLGASFRPNPWLAVALRVDGRYDWHSHLSTGDTSGWVGEPTILARFEPPMEGDVRVGAEAGLAFPGRKVPSIEPNATSPELSLYATFAPSAASFAVGARAGFRLDRGDRALADPDRLTRPQRLSIGVSDTNALLLGLAGAARVAKHWEALAEWTWDLRVPANGTTALESPMRIDAGARVIPDVARSHIQIQLLVEVSPSARPTIGSGEPLVIVEPRVGLFVGLTFLPLPPALASGGPRPIAP